MKRTIPYYLGRPAHVWIAAMSPRKASSGPKTLPMASQHDNDNAHRRSSSVGSLSAAGRAYAVRAITRGGPASPRNVEDLASPVGASRQSPHTDALDHSVARPWGGDSRAGEAGLRQEGKDRYGDER